MEVLRFFAFSFLLSFSFVLASDFPWRHQDSPRIIGGENVTINQVPYQLSLQYNGSHVCGASIIGRLWALTAAHCLLGDFGYYDLRSGTDKLGQGGRLHPATKIYVIPNYDESTADYDVALIRTYEPFDFGDTRQPIPLTTTEPEKGSTLFVSGWGLTEEDGSSGLPTQLQGVSVPYVDRETCKNLIASVTDRMICAGAEGKDSCSEDSGGPLVLNNTQVGIVSWGIGCGQANSPGVYTNLANAEIQDWIKNVTEF